jgi:hypothetical protein
MHNNSITLGVIAKDDSSYLKLELLSIPLHGAKTR